VADVGINHLMPRFRGIPPLRDPLAIELSPA
jgi:hypothetical protein